MFKQSLQTIREVKSNSFIFEQSNALAESFCADVIQRFENSKEGQYDGRIGQLANKDSSIKKSTDLVVSGKEDWKDVDRALFRSLGLAIREFRKIYPFFKGHLKTWAMAFKEPTQANTITGISMAAAMNLAIAN